MLQDERIQWHQERCPAHRAAVHSRPRSRDDSGAASSHGGPTFCLGAEHGGDAEPGC
jgi:hypothetical protein